MRVTEPGKSCDGLYYLGREESGIYLLEGSDGSMIISGGISYILPDVLNQIRAFEIDEGRISKLLILHSHYDHVGIVPFFKRRHPEIEIYASKRAWEILKMPKAINNINAFSRMNAEKMGKIDDITALDVEWRDDIQGVPVYDGDRIELGDLQIHILETPGHSPCSVSAYVPQFKALFPSDGGGVPFRDIIIAAGNSNFTLFQQSLEKMNRLDVEFLCSDHYGYVAGDDAKHFMSRSIESARKERALIEEVYRKTGDIDRTAHELTTSFYRDYPGFVLPFDIFEGNYRLMVKHIAETMKP